jgi:type IV secretion system protein VirB9
MDTRRFVNWRALNGRLLAMAVAAVALGGCTTLRGFGPSATPAPTDAVAGPAAAAVVVPVAAIMPVTPPVLPVPATMTPIPNPAAHGPLAPHPRRQSSGHRRRAPAPPAVSTPPIDVEQTSGRTVISNANRAARETSTVQGFVGGVQVFAYDPGRVYEVWTAPLRVTTLTLSPGESIVSKAAGDTVRWQIGETTSGEGPRRRAHVMIKPLRTGLETNLVLSTSQRVYLIELRSGPAEGFNAAVSWDLGSVLPPIAVAAASAPKPEPLVAPAGPLDARYRIEARGRRPAWTPTSVMTDGVHTFLAFPPALASTESPALFALAPGGEAQLVNYRQQDGLWVVDRVLDAAELRLGDRHPQIVRIVRAPGGRS